MIGDVGHIDVLAMGCLLGNILVLRIIGLADIFVGSIIGVRDGTIDDVTIRYRIGRYITGHFEIYLHELLLGAEKRFGSTAVCDLRPAGRRSTLIGAPRRCHP